MNIIVSSDFPLSGFRFGVDVEAQPGLPDDDFIAGTKLDPFAGALRHRDDVPVLQNGSALRAAIVEQPELAGCGIELDMRVGARNCWIRRLGKFLESHIIAAD